ncbi:arginine--tRNA ligase [Methanobacterium alcaliphilum]|uniref:arginine--tRNA ligase n=1 Tax=Methanobacterium alcaliphilum TaxID=392018 RepID=UPI00200A7C56|nr:arginine--tRNA ligase [Methanobacterium alcaliphilum]MCK9151157.1 arginine--tRNA ligase [Methanobacterium alcaliphilum]
MFNIIEIEALESLKKALNQLNYPVPSEIKLEEPPNPQMGDLATTISFQLAKELKKSPMEITISILGALESPEIFESVESKGPYINFFVDYKKFSRMVVEGIDENYGQLPRRSKKIILEHTSANPNGPLHIGHVRNAIIGDSLSRVLRAAGYELETQYYVNDMGRQIAMVVWGLINIGDDLESYGSGEKKDHQIGKLYYQVNQALKENPEMKIEIDQLIKRYENGEDPDLNEKFKFAVSSCIDGMRTTMQNLHINHDAFVWEGKFVRNGSVWDIVDKLKESGHTKQNEVLYLDLEDFGLEKELVLTRSDGTSLYSTRDLAYHMEKSEKGDIILDILGSDHKLAIDQIRIAMGLLGDKSPEVIFYEFITLPEGSMSTRRGVFISVDDLMDEAIKRALNEIKKRRPDLNPEESDKIAREIGIGAIRYYIARLSPEKHIVFKWDDALSFERGCASIQYAHARAGKLLEKSEAFSEDEVTIESHWTPENIEIDLIRTLAKFPKTVEESARIRRVHNIAQYAQDLANAFNKFYKSTPVIGSPYENARLLLVEKSKMTLKNCLELLGVSAPESM